LIKPSEDQQAGGGEWFRCQVDTAASFYASAIVEFPNPP
jgi:hypothetical protein